LGGGKTSLKRRERKSTEKHNVWRRKYIYLIKRIEQGGRRY